MPGGKGAGKNIPAPGCLTKSPSFMAEGLVRGTAGTLGWRLKTDWKTLDPMA